MSVYGLRRGGFCEFGCAIISFDATGDALSLPSLGPSPDWPFLGISNEAYTPESGVQSYGSHETSGHKCLGITELQAKCRPSSGGVIAIAEALRESLNKHCF